MSGSNKSVIKEILQERLKQDSTRFDSIKVYVQIAAMGVSKVKMNPLNISNFDFGLGAKDFNSSIISRLA